LAAHVPNALLYPAIVAYPTAYSTDNDKDDEDDNARLAAGVGVLLQLQATVADMLFACRAANR
jgi:hypothetical protein